MSDREPPELARTVDEHPASVAWRAVRPDHRVPSAVETVRANKPTGRCVYRLLNATEEGDPVIAKRYRVAAHNVERMFYRDVLPLLPVSTPRYYGELDANDGYAWIFLEDAGREQFFPGDSRHRVLAARWLGAMHVAAPEFVRIDRLPDRGPRHYRARLDAGRRLILDNLDNPGLQLKEIRLLRSIIALSNMVERRWHELEEICAAAPCTLVHGDFRPKNVFVQDAAEGRQRVLAIDWEMSGWGVPAADLAPSSYTLRSISMGHHCVPQVDLEEYCRVVQQRWSGFDVPLARRLLWVGLIFRRLAAIEWASLSLVFTETEVLATPLSWLRSYGEQLHRALHDQSLGAPR